MNEVSKKEVEEKLKDLYRGKHKSSLYLLIHKPVHNEKGLLSTNTPTQNIQTLAQSIASVQIQKN